MERGGMTSSASGAVPTEYVITARVFGTRPHPISAATYADLVHAADDLLACLAVEEAYDVLIRNYVSLEKSMANALVDFMVERNSSRLAYERLRREADRQLVNLLASGEMYADHVHKTLKRRERAATRRGRSAGDGVATIAAMTEAQRAKFLGVRALEAMRNHVLHLSLPVNGWHQGNAWVDHEGEEVMRHTYSVNLSPQVLEEVREVKRELIDELKARAVKGRVSWLPLVREYVEGASNVHAAARTALGLLEAAARELVDREIAAYRSATGIPDETVGMMAAARIGAKGELEAVRAIDFNYAELMDDLRSRNAAPQVNLHRRQLLG